MDLNKLARQRRSHLPVVAVSSKGWCELSMRMTTEEYLKHVTPAKPVQYGNFKSVLDAIVADGVPDDKAIIIDSMPEAPDPSRAKDALNYNAPRNRAERRRLQYGKKRR